MHISKKRCFVLPLITLPLLFITASAVARVQSSDAFERFSAEEKMWLAEHPKIRLGVGIAFPPYQWVEKEDGEHVFKGIVSDYVKLLEKRLNTRMEIVFGIGFKQALAMGRNKEIDLFPCLAQSPERSEFLLFTEPYLSYQSVIITRDDEPFMSGFHGLKGRRIAVVKHLVAYSKLKADYSHLNLTFVETKSISGNLEAVSTGRADACITDLGTAGHYIQKRRLFNLKVAAPTDWSGIHLAMGVRDDWPVLKSIVQKTLNSISTEEKDAINAKWVRIEYTQGIEQERVLRYALWIGSAVIVFFLVFFLWNRSLKKEIFLRKRIEADREQLIQDLKQALGDVKQLSGLLPVCASCKKIRDDQGYWNQLDTYIRQHTDANVTHGLCPDCMDKLYAGQEWYEKGKRKGKY